MIYLQVPEKVSRTEQEKPNFDRCTVKMNAAEPPPSPPENGYFDNSGRFHPPVIPASSAHQAPSPQNIDDTDCADPQDLSFAHTPCEEQNNNNLEKSVVDVSEEATDVVPKQEPVVAVPMEEPVVVEPTVQARTTCYSDHMMAVCDEFERFLASVSTSENTICDNKSNVKTETLTNGSDINHEDYIDLCYSDDDDAMEVINVSDLVTVHQNMEGDRPPVLKPYYDDVPSLSSPVHVEIKKEPEISKDEVVVETPNEEQIAAVVDTKQDAPTGMDRIEEDEQTEEPKNEEKQTEVPEQPNYNLKEAKVILNRINIKEYFVNKLRKRIQQTDDETPENKQVRHAITVKTPPSSFPLQDRNLRVRTRREPTEDSGKKTPPPQPPLRRSTRKRNALPEKSNEEEEAKQQRLRISPNTINRLMKEPKVVLEKLRLEDLQKTVLANVPGMNDLELIQPEPNAAVVQVVQVPGGNYKTLF